MNNKQKLKFSDLEELRDRLGKEGIKYRYFDTGAHPFITGPVIYVSALDQIEKPTKKQTEAFMPYIRVTRHNDKKTYYVRDTGAILESVSLSELIRMIKTNIENGKKYL